MVLGKQGLRLEAYKFGVYLFIPIVASISFNDPELRKKCVDYFQFLKYPANPNTNLIKEYEEIREREMKQREQRRVYKEQLQKLRELEEKRKDLLSGDKGVEDEKESGGKRWFGWFRRFRRGGGSGGSNVDDKREERVASKHQ